MSQTPLYTEYHPRWYRTRVSTWWWMRRGAYLVFILREVSSAFIAWFIVYTLLFIRAINAGNPAYEGFKKWSAHPLVVGLNVISVFFIFFHAITWLNLAPKAMVVKFRGQRVAAKWILIANFLAWAAVSALLALVLLG